MPSTIQFPFHSNQKLNIFVSFTYIFSMRNVKLRHIYGKLDLGFYELCHWNDKKKKRKRAGYSCADGNSVGETFAV